MKKEVDALLLKLQLSNKRDDFPSNLSGGQQRKVCFGMAIVSDASVGYFISLKNYIFYIFHFNWLFLSGRL